MLDGSPVVSKRSSSIVPKRSSSVVPKRSSSVADPSVTVAIGELESIGVVSIVVLRETVYLRNAHNTQTPELICQRKQSTDQKIPTTV